MGSWQAPKLTSRSDREKPIELPTATSVPNESQLSDLDNPSKWAEDQAGLPLKMRPQL
jgi:hypothetical protein